ncbi:unnamed protein product [Rotaria magnacalcarata]|uniref:Uncharacterized protein n=3 Tax=Rotaria magnacalcarata TaxID=392030 RepID=A0A819DZ02_9BILA|nr:unnamed protein product [Rotaria magnacalcarata]CAF2034185.1 unnamed protein product [Rotaria magnacalcarata]CAF2124057.1 unnamed protein product [Rotaria magnacalcarata]CAF3829163.1 unnamed protein product [Rotaria magnacalcarata]CAF3841395.1 unnamed protein product [Rotaria magnacalcarata]
MLNGGLLLLSNQSIDNYINNIHRQSTHQTNLEQDKSLVENKPIPNYYEWSLCDINAAHTDLFNQMPSQRSQNLSKLESLTYFNCKKTNEFSLTYDRTIRGDYIYAQQQFGTSQMSRPHPLRNSIPCEEQCRWMPIRSSSMIGRRAHLPLDLF